jgi:hypothetical protein
MTFSAFVNRAIQMKSLLLCTDLDRTLIPNGPQPESPEARPLFRQWVEQPQVTLSYVTGRDASLTQAAIAEYGLPWPEFVIADVGSSLYRVHSPQTWQRWQDWDAYISLDWQGKTAQHLQSRLSSVLAQFPDCQLQEPEKQGQYKLSYYVSLRQPLDPLLQALQAWLDEQQLWTNLIWSIDEQAQVGLLDLLPRRASKSRAIFQLMAQCNFSLEQTVFSGDSGNDLDVFLSPISSILVANASPELKTQLQTPALAQSLYLARGGYQNLNGNYSAGILEGLAYYFPHLGSWPFRDASIRV